MIAFVIVDIGVTDPVGLQRISKWAPDAVNLYGGKYVARVIGTPIGL